MFVKNVSKKKAFRIQQELRRNIKVIKSIQALKPSDVVVRKTPVPAVDLVSVVIPMRNAALWIDSCLKGILGQTHKNLEVFCVDDCSSDDSYTRVLEQFGKDRRLCVFRLRHRVGPYQIKNWITSLFARGLFIAMQDADDVSHPSRILEQRRWMARMGWRVSGTCVHQFFPENVKPLFGTSVEVHAEGYVHNLALYTTIHATRLPYDFEKILGTRKDYVSKHGSQMFERSVLLEFGGFDGHTMIGADTELNWRLLRLMDVGNVPIVLYSRRLHCDSLTSSLVTGHGSSMRIAYVAARDAHHCEIAKALAGGDIFRVDDLLRADLYYGDIEVEEVRAGFDLNPSRLP